MPKYHLPDEILLFVLECEDFRSHLCALDFTLEAPAHGRLLARARFVQACKFYWEALSGKMSLLGAAIVDLSFTRANDEYNFFRLMALALAETSTQFGENFFCQGRIVCSVSQLVMEEVFARASIPPGYRESKKDCNTFGYFRFL